MWPDRVSNPGPLTYESGALPTALRGLAILLELRGKSLCKSIYIYSNVRSCMDAHFCVFFCHFVQRETFFCFDRQTFTRTTPASNKFSFEPLKFYCIYLNFTHAEAKSKFAPLFPMHTCLLTFNDRDCQICVCKCSSEMVARWLLKDVKNYFSHIIHVLILVFFLKFLLFVRHQTPISSRC